MTQTQIAQRVPAALNQQQTDSGWDGFRAPNTQIDRSVAGHIGPDMHPLHDGQKFAVTRFFGTESERNKLLPLAIAKAAEWASDVIVYTNVDRNKTDDGKPSNLLQWAKDVFGGEVEAKIFQPKNANGDLSAEQLRTQDEYYKTVRAKYRDNAQISEISELEPSYRSKSHTEEIFRGVLPNGATITVVGLSNDNFQAGIEPINDGITRCIDMAREGKSGDNARFSKKSEASMTFFSAEVPLDKAQQGTLLSRLTDETVIFAGAELESHSLDRAETNADGTKVWAHFGSSRNTAQVCRVSDFPRIPLAAYLRVVGEVQDCLKTVLPNHSLTGELKSELLGKLTNAFDDVKIASGFLEDLIANGGFSRGNLPLLGMEERILACRAENRRHRSAATGNTFLPEDRLSLADIKDADADFEARATLARSAVVVERLGMPLKYNHQGTWSPERQAGHLDKFDRVEPDGKVVPGREQHMDTAGKYFLLSFGLDSPPIRWIRGQSEKKQTEGNNQ